MRCDRNSVKFSQKRVNLFCKFLLLFGGNGISFFFYPISWNGCSPPCLNEGIFTNTKYFSQYTSVKFVTIYKHFYGTLHVNISFIEEASLTLTRLGFLRLEKTSRACQFDPSPLTPLPNPPSYFMRSYLISI